MKKRADFQAAVISSVSAWAAAMQSPRLTSRWVTRRTDWGPTALMRMSRALSRAVRSAAVWLPVRRKMTMLVSTASRSAIRTRRGTRQQGHHVLLTLKNIERSASAPGRSARPAAARHDGGRRPGDRPHRTLRPPGHRGYGKNFVLCPGRAYDRSPCGTGTSAKLACLAADGKHNPGNPAARGHRRQYSEGRLNSATAVSIRGFAAGRTSPAKRHSYSIPTTRLSHGIPSIIP